MSVGLKMLIVMFALAVLLVPVTIAMVIMAFRAAKRKDQSQA